MIQTILFDLDDTLLWDKKSIATAFEKTCRYASSQKAIDPAQLEQAVREKARDLYASYDTYAFTQMIGINPFEGLWGTFDDPGVSFQQMKNLIASYQRDAWTSGLAQVGIHDDQLGETLADRFIEERHQSPFVYAETFEVLDRLKGVYRLGLLTNGAPSLQQKKLEITPELVPYFDRIIISGVFGKGKPDASIFQHALEQLDSTADETIMVGDNFLTDILGASRVGMRSVWINREGKAPHPEIQATYEITNLNGLFDILASLNETSSSYEKPKNQH